MNTQNSKTSTTHSGHRKFFVGKTQPDQVEMQMTAQIQTRLNKLTETAGSVQSVLGGCVALQNERQSVAGCFMLRRDASGALQFGSRAMKSDEFNLDTIAKGIFPRAEDGLSKNLPTIASVPDQGFECVIVPTRVMDNCAMVSVVRGVLSTKQRSLELAIGQIFTSFLDGASNRDRLCEISSQMTTTAATLELVMRCQKATTINNACLQVVSDLKEHYKCDQVFIGLTSGRKTCKIKAASDVAVIDPNSETTLAMKAVLDESITRDAVGAWPPLPGVEPHQLLAHKQIAKRDSLVITTPLKTIDGEIIGAIAMLGRREMATIPNLHHFVGSIGEPLGETLATVQLNQGSWPRRALRAMFSDKHRIKVYCALAAALASVLILALPWPYTINCKSLIEPVERRFCVAPHDGLIETTLAQPGDVVQPGQMLAQMDGREILWELAGVSAKKSRAAKKRDSHMSKHETPEALMADLELKSLQNQESLLQFKESNLQMSSPIEGIVLSGSLDRRENYPVTKGQVLYEIAPLDQLRIEVAMPADEVMHVQPNDSVELYVDGFGIDSVSGSIDRIRPRAEIRDGENVFIAEVTIANEARQLRPGMQGTAKVKTQTRSVAWIVFHHAVERMRAAMPW